MDCPTSDAQEIGLTQAYANLDKIVYMCLEELKSREKITKLAILTIAPLMCSA